MKEAALMEIDFLAKNVIHSIAVKLVNANLPTVKKAFHLRALHQPRIDIHGIASKAALYDVSASPKTIEEGMNAGMIIMYHLAAEGYKIDTPLFSLRTRIPGEYDGTEESLPPDITPVASLRISKAFRKFMEENATLSFSGKQVEESFISKATDNATNLEDEVMTKGNYITIRGRGLKIRADDSHKDQVGVFFVPKSGEPIKASIIAINTQKTLMVHVPTELTKGQSYQLAVETQSPARNSGYLLKNVRDVRSEFRLTAA
jgi:hypothetical protein